MTKEQFEKAKIEAARKALPHMMDPEGMGPANLTYSECALLMARDEKSIPSGDSMAKTEKAALARLGEQMRSIGVTCAADCLTAGK